MPAPRVIPCLLIQNGRLVKTVRFSDPTYVGDPLNAIKIFNEKECDELVLLDIGATREKQPPPFALIREIAGECFMPLCFGGALSSLDDISRVVASGVEKVGLNSVCIDDPDVVEAAARRFGSQSIVASIDVRIRPSGTYEVFTHGGTRKTGLDPVTHAQRVESMGAGEILLTSVERDGTRSGYDVELIRRVSSAVGIPVIACGGAGRIEDFMLARAAGASAAAAGSMFIFHGGRRAVLITYPPQSDLGQLLEPDS